MRLLALFALCVCAIVPAMSADQVVIPVASPFSGALASYGEGVRNAALLFEEHVNARGGIAGKPVKIQLEDDVGDNKVAVNIATRLAADPNVVIVIGHLTSGACGAANPVYMNGKLPSISPSATNPQLGVNSPFFFRNVYKDDFQGAFLARYAAKARGYKRIAIFNETSDYSTGLKNAFVAEAPGQGLEIIATEAYSSGTTDFAPLLSKFRLLRPDAIFVPGYGPEGTSIITQARKLGLTMPIFGADGLDDAVVLNNENADGVFVTTPFLIEAAGPDSKSFIDAYTTKYGTAPNWFAANTYDALQLAADAITKGGVDRAGVLKALTSYKDAASAFVGVTGATFFDENGDCLKPAFVKEVKGGKWVAAEQQLQ